MSSCVVLDGADCPDWVQHSIKILDGFTSSFAVDAAPLRQPLHVRCPTQMPDWWPRDDSDLHQESMPSDQMVLVSLIFGKWGARLRRSGRTSVMTFCFRSFSDVCCDRVNLFHCRMRGTGEGRFESKLFSVARSYCFLFIS